MLSASRGYHFQELGFWDEAKEYTNQLASNLPLCQEKNVNPLSNDKIIEVENDVLGFTSSNTNDSKPQNKIVAPVSVKTNAKKTAIRKHNDQIDTETLCVNKRSVNENLNEIKAINSGGIIGNESRVNVPKSDYPWMVFIVRKQGTPQDTRCKLTGSGFYINENTILTAAHNILYKGCQNTKWRVKSNGFIDEARDWKITSEWKANPGNNNSLSDHIYDFGVLKTNHESITPLFPILYLGPIFPATIDDVGTTLGFPYQINGQVVNGSTSGGNLFKENRSVFDDLTVLDESNSGILISHYFDQTPGSSGGPLFYSHNPYFPTPVIGVASVITGSYNYVTPISSNYAHEEIVDWMSESPPNIIININSPNYLETIEWNTIADTTFSASTSSTTRTAIKEDVNSNLIWESDVDGVFGSGTSVTAIEAKSKLRPGLHVVKLSIETAQYSGQDHLQFYITGPEGSFTMSSTFCIINLQNNPNSCIIPISWQTTNASGAFVFNNRDNSAFSNNPQGSNVPFTAVHNQDTELVLYASQDKIYDIDRANLSAKLPTGTLTKNSSVCSLQPSPVNPHTGQFRDPKATPPGCGAVLSWSNVKWASPSIFYKPISGKGDWQFLYQIPCALDGSVCNGSINTDEVSPELIPTSGVEFKLLQFNNSKSGVLTQPFLITAHRFADSYEFDDGDLSRFNYPNGTTDGFPSSYQFDNTYSNSIELDTIQNHNFHSPAAYDSNIDVDTVQVPINVLGDFEVGQGHQLSVTVSNMAPGLDVGFAVECAGFGINRTNPFEPFDFQGSYGFQTSPIISDISDPANNSRTMKFRLKKNAFVNVNGHLIGMGCLYNRIVINRLSGTPSENLTYSVTVSEVVQINGPDAYDDVPNQRAYDDDVRERPVLWGGGTTQHTHNFHDSGDTDWTIVYAQGNIRFRTQLIGANADTKMSVYKWTGGQAHPSGNGTFINITDQFLASDNSVGSSQVIINNGALATYAVKIQSRTNAFGNDTEYKLLLDLLPPTVITPDAYDDVPNQRAYDDDVRERPVLWGGGTTQHTHNFHDSGDTDWTIVYAQGNIRFRTQLIGANADTKMSVYKWTGGQAHPSGNGTFINITDQFLASDNSVGSSQVIINNGALATYAVKIQSRTNAFGNDTEYKLLID